MENSNLHNKGSLYKCPYQSQVYGTNKSELCYRKPYQGDWGDWDDAPDTHIQEEKDFDLAEKENLKKVLKHNKK